MIVLEVAAVINNLKSFYMQQALNALPGSFDKGPQTSVNLLLNSIFTALTAIPNDNASTAHEPVHMTMRILEEHARYCIAHGMDMKVLIDMDGYDLPEIIVNPPENIEKKIEYYKNTYDDECKHKHAPIRIVGVLF